MKLTKYIRGIWYRNSTVTIYILCVALRVILVFVPQTGYIHPDEFFQSVEVFLGDEYNLEHDRTWEFNNTFPIRSIIVPYIIFRIPLTFLHFLSLYVRHYFGIELRTSYVFLVFPRLIMCLLSFLNDASLYRICRAYSLRFETRLLALGSTFVILVFGTRTFSNTIEMTLCSILLYLVSDCMIHSNSVIHKTEILQTKYHEATSISEKVKLYKLRSALPTHSFNRVILIATLCVFGVFNRPTFLIFGAPIVFFWLLRGMGTTIVTFFDFNLRIILLCLCAAPTIVFCTLADSLYYNYLTSGEILLLDIGINNFVFTPWNFVKYNIDPTKTAHHGVHPRFLHLLVNIPLLFNILGIAAILSFGKLIVRFLRGDYRNLPRSQSISALMTSAIFLPLGAMSYINHQEPRFLLPLTLPIILLHGPKLDGISMPNPFIKSRPILRKLYDKFIPTKIARRTVLRIWCSTNAILILFYGFLHQGGVYQLSAHMSQVMKTKATTTNVHLITNHLYSFPLSFVNIPSSKTIYIDRRTRKKYRRSQEFFVEEMGSIDTTRILTSVSNILRTYSSAEEQKSRYQIYIAMPSSLSDEFDELYKRNLTDMKFSRVRNFYPHLSTEALPNPLKNYWTNNLWSISGAASQIVAFIQQFGLTLYRYQS